ncbi:MAG: hypothetical protein KW802_00215 [Candidatus Doudnabacteria bacterium]|nr:hypothetical protein [Candidatus Doudnabacteria bacterium]
MIADSIVALMAVIAVVLLCGFVGQKIAKDRGQNPNFGMAIGAALPVVGVGILLFLGRKSRRY